MLKEKDFELMKRISEGDESAFKELFEGTHRKVYFYLFRLFHEKSMAEDLVIETYSEVWINAMSFKRESRVITWIIGIARNLAMNKFKSLHSNERIDDYPDIPEPKDSSGSQFNGKKELINQAMKKLSFKHREVLDLVFFQEMTYKEVSEILKIPINTVKTRVFYAKKELRGILNKMGVKKDDI